jgi:hypothetical protein
MAAMVRIGRERVLQIFTALSEVAGCVSMHDPQVGAK